MKVLKALCSWQVTALQIPLGTCFFLFLFSSNAQTNLQQELSLKEAVNTAIQNNPSLRENVEKVHQAENGIPIARSFIFPNISTTASGQRAKDAVNIALPRFDGNSFNIYQASLKVTQLIFQVGTIAAIDSAEKDVGISKLNARISARNLVSNTVQVYYQIVVNARNVDALLRQQKIVKESLAVAEQRVRTGRGKVLDVLQIKTQLALLDGQISTARNQLQIAIANLANLLGGDIQKEIRIKDKLNAPDIPEIDNDVDLKNYSIPEIEIDTLSISKIDDQRTVSYGQNLPNLSFFGNYNYSSFKQSDLFEKSSNSWGLGLQLTIPLFSGFSLFYQDRSLLSQRLQFELDKKNVENQISYQQITSRKNLETAQDTIRTGTEALKLAVASSNVARRNFRDATIDFLQLLSIEQAYVQAEQSLNNYRYNYIVALAAYYAASGQDMNKLVAILERTEER